ncbi:MAG: flagellar biosynthesis anti-sigma factor FlgM [Candidatus Wallbacteria bacterium]|nr:flagellar biosynthesis anti-sigma factor FlgM [Candidatus Wallbacteria bacterium]
MTVIPKDPVRIDDSVKKERADRARSKEDFQKVFKKDISQIDGPDTRTDKVEAARKSDSTTLSSESRDIAVVRKAISESPEVREELVARIKEEIKNGTYEFDLDKVAESMIESGIFDDL